MAKFEKGNNAAERWTEEDAINAFELAYDNTLLEGDILSLQDAFFSIEMRPSTAGYLVNKFPVLEAIKNDISSYVISRINKMALRNKYNPTASIWRMKQLGERDEKYVDQTTKGEKITQPITEDQLDKIIDNL